MSALMLFLIRIYQAALSPFMGNHCRFYPSCSSYSAEAIKKHGCIRGAGLGFLRVLKCHPFHPGGIDHVPEHFRPAGPGAEGKAARTMIAHDEKHALHRRICPWRKIHQSGKS